MHDVPPKPGTDQRAGGQPKRLRDDRTLAGVGLLLSGVLGAVAATAYTWTGDIPGLRGPDPVVQIGVPVIRVVLHLAAASTVGLTMLPILSGQHGRSRAARALAAARRAATATALVWVLCCLVSIPLHAAEIMPGHASPNTVLRYALGVPAAGGLLISSVCAAVTAALCLAANRPPKSPRRDVHPVLPILFAVLGLLPIPLTGHLTAGGAHGLAVLSVELHVVGAAVWSGGLLSIVLCLAPLRGLLASTLPRYSKLAGAALAVVGLSGVFNGVTELVLTPGVDLAGLVTTGYGQLVLAKVVSLVALGVLGAHVRWRLLPRIARHQRTALLTWIGVELAVMGVAYGLGAVLARIPVA